LYGVLTVDILFSHDFVHFLEFIELIELILIISIDFVASFFKPLFLQFQVGSFNNETLLEEFDLRGCQLLLVVRDGLRGNGLVLEV
jgi:hypothetical protein